MVMKKQAPVCNSQDEERSNSVLKRRRLFPGLGWGIPVPALYQEQGGAWPRILRNAV